MKIDCESIFREDLFLYNCLQIPSAVAFLTGAFPAAQPRGFAPYVVCDPVVGSYQVRFHFSLFSASYSKRSDICIYTDSVRFCSLALDKQSVSSNSGAAAVGATRMWT